MSERVVFPKPCEVAIVRTEVPEPSKGQVLIKTLVTLISTGTELTILSGDFPLTQLGLDMDIILSFLVTQILVSSLR
ncbi:hypothetical protein KEJ19_01685 [Candidatus Bathyarchaeota archaeon]|nr:hypothetical protein [Candidatus Bathyarchaeota archaeon]